jgi:hypothetical protein
MNPIIAVLGIIGGMIGLTSGWTLVDLFHILYAFIDLLVYALMFGWSAAMIAKCKVGKKQKPKKKVRTQRRKRSEVIINRRKRMHERHAKQREAFRMRQLKDVVLFEPERQQQPDHNPIFTITRTHPLLPARSQFKKYKQKTNRLDNKTLQSLI